MILTDILNILESDSELQSLLEGTTTDKKIYGFGTTELNSIVYDYVDLTSNKIIGQARLTLTINTLKVDYDLNLEIVSKVKQLLLTLADEKLNNDILTVEQNGGGMLENQETSTIHNKIIFTIKYKERN
ncbi:MAG: hypothetical protein AAGU76_02745 [Sedimentibacter sp.]|uniref:hypothetical protein n=1 Tax=Sedimentibacter sp. TaxID=1960295 RepID=UPI0031590CD0